MNPLFWVKELGFLAAFLIVLFLAYTVGHQRATDQWSAKYTALQVEYSEMKTAEVTRQEKANREAKRVEAEKIAALEAQNRELEELVEVLEHEAVQDANADRVCLSIDSGLRINQVR